MLSLPAGMTIANEPGTISVRFASPASAGEAGDGGAVVSTTLSVILMKNGVPAAGGSGVALTETDGVLTVSQFDSPGSAVLSLPGAVLRSIVLNMPATLGSESASFDINITDSGVVVRAKNALAQATIQSNRDAVIALVLAEVRRQNKAPLDRITSVFIDQN